MMNNFEVGALLNFFFDPSVGFCCCIPIVGLLGSLAGAMHLQRHGAALFRRSAIRMPRAGAAHARLK